MPNLQHKTPENEAKQTTQNQKVKTKYRQIKVMNHTNSLYETHLQVLRAIEAQPDLTQRQLAEELGISLGKAHYCIKALIDKGLVKMGNFSHNQKKLDYAYLLTSSGIKSKAMLTAHFLERKAAEYAPPQE